MSISPINMIAAIGAIATLPWRELDKHDRYMFADAGDDARICFVPEAAQGIICEALDIRATLEGGLLAIIGGDGLQIELHGCDDEGEPIQIAIPLAVIEH